MTVVGRLRMFSESRTSVPDAVTNGIRAVLHGIEDAQNKRIAVDDLRLERAEPGKYCVSMRVLVEALGSGAATA